MLLFYVDFRLGAFSLVAYYRWGIFDGRNYFVNIVSWLICQMEQGTCSPIVSHSGKKYIFHTIKRTSILFHFMFLLVRQVGSSYYHFILFLFWPVRRETWLHDVLLWTVKTTSNSLKFNLSLDNSTIPCRTYPIQNSKSLWDWSCHLGLSPSVRIQQCTQGLYCSVQSIQSTASLILETMMVF